MTRLRYVFSDPHLSRRSRYEVPWHVSIDLFDALDATEFATEALVEDVMLAVSRKVQS